MPASLLLTILFTMCRSTKFGKCLDQLSLVSSCSRLQESLVLKGKLLKKALICQVLIVLSTQRLVHQKSV